MTSTWRVSIHKLSSLLDKLISNTRSYLALEATDRFTSFLMVHGDIEVVVIVHHVQVASWSDAHTYREVGKTLTTNTTKAAASVAVNLKTEKC